MSGTWRVAAVQTDVALGDLAANRAMLVAKTREAAAAGAKLVVFPECAVTGYGFRNRADAVACGESVDGPSVSLLSDACATLGTFVAFGFLETSGERLFNSCALVGPNGLVACYRKVHLPCIGADRFTDPGDRPFAVHDLGGLKVGLHICFDGSFPESARVMALQGADAILLPTNWADKAIRMARLVPRTRAFENHLYFVAVNRVGTEPNDGYHYVGHSSISDPVGDLLAIAEHDREEILYADLDPTAARQKRIVHCVGEYEIDRVNWRRPDLYGPLVEGTPFPGHKQK